MLKRSHYIALGLVLVLTLVIINLPEPDHRPHEARLSGACFSRCSGWPTRTQILAGKAAMPLSPRGELLRQNELLRRENQQLRLQIREARKSPGKTPACGSCSAGNSAPAGSSSWPMSSCATPPIGGAPSSIDLGSRDGMRTNLARAHRATDYLVGRIDSVSLTRSQVVLLGDPHCKVAALVENETRDTGVIGGFGTARNLVGRNEHAFPAMPTSSPARTWSPAAWADIFPKDIPIGKVVDSHLVEYGLYVVARVRLAANLGALEEVWVLFAMKTFTPILSCWPRSSRSSGPPPLTSSARSCGAQVDLLPALDGLCQLGSAA